MLKQEAMKELGVSLYRLNKVLAKLHITSIGSEELIQIKTYLAGYTPEYIDMDTKTLKQTKALLDYIDTYGFDAEYVQHALKGMKRDRDGAWEKISKN